ncbi:hypothetical protein [Microlunatus sp. GCM10028923]|uniref:hypothetical protein n=1 Tax=Microlunatus sp. GCM10028923 TaxID=3273400 RepID=UPI0036084D8C
MTQVCHHHDELRVDFPGWEALLAGRSTLVVPAASVLGAEVSAGWSYEVLGARSGLVISGFRKLGTFTHPDGTRRLVSMKRGLPLLRVRVRRETTGFDELLISTPEAEVVAAAVRSAVAR